MFANNEPSTSLINNDSHDSQPPIVSDPQPLVSNHQSIFTRRSRDEQHPFTLRRAATTLLRPEIQVDKNPGFIDSIKHIICDLHYFNLLLVCIPISWAIYFAVPDSYILITIFSFLAKIPLPKLISLSTDEIAIRVSRTLGILITITLGNIVELVLAIVSLVKCRPQLVQSSIIGFILNNLLLRFGLSVLAWGFHYSMWELTGIATTLNPAMLIVFIASIGLPATFSFSLPTKELGSTDIIKISHGLSVILLFGYTSYVFFQLYSHVKIYEESLGSMIKCTVDEIKKDKDKERNSSANHKQEVHMSFIMSVVVLIMSTGLVAFTANILIDSTGNLVQRGSISENFNGLILLPLAANAAEHLEIIMIFEAEKLAMSLGTVMASSIQIALFVFPLVVMLGWFLNKPLNFMFDLYETIVLFLTGK
ncbi:hypothetical protein VKT23_008973 [Stygiomarasmius scandens]|uniref:Sodium/calcium exchanger membrane region domain-containing protein n=1 Tax=Marasmiellus scandens TaxID=2682957 RepID=A0ABR1JIV9_9AGAR